MATKTIGSGGDYTSYASYLTYLQTLGTLSAPEFGQQKNEEITVAAGINFSGFTPTSTNRWTLETVAGGSFRDHANKLTNALRYNASNGAAIKSTNNYANTVVVSVPFATVRNLQILNAGFNGWKVLTANNFGGAGNLIFEGLILQCTQPDADIVAIDGTADVIRNCLIILDGTRSDCIPIGICASGGQAHFCTIVRPSNRTAGNNMLRANYGASSFNNCAWFNFASTRLGGATISGANNATDQASFPTGLSGQTGLTGTTEFEQPSNASGAMDFRLKSTSVKCKDNGSTDSTNGATDIIGTSRPQGSAYDIGCWELAAAGGQTLANPFCLLGVGRAI